MDGRSQPTAVCTLHRRHVLRQPGPDRKLYTGIEAGSTSCTLSLLRQLHTRVWRGRECELREGGTAPWAHRWQGSRASEVPRAGAGYWTPRRENRAAHMSAHGQLVAIHRTRIAVARPARTRVGPAPRRRGRGLDATCDRRCIYEVCRSAAQQATVGQYARCVDTGNGIYAGVARDILGLLIATGIVNPQDKSLRKARLHALRLALRRQRAPNEVPSVGVDVVHGLCERGSGHGSGWADAARSSAMQECASAHVLQWVGRARRPCARPRG